MMSAADIYETEVTPILEKSQAEVLQIYDIGQTYIKQR